MKDSTFNPDQQQRHLASKVVAGLERISEVFKVLLWDQATAVGLSPIQIQIMVFIAYHTSEMCKVSYLAWEFNVSKPTISDAVRVLKNKGLITQHPAPDDGRSYTIALTDHGREIVDKTIAFTSPLEKEIEQLGLHEMEGLWHTLSRLIYQLNRSGILTIQRTCHACIHFEPGNTGDQGFCKFLQKELYTQDIRLDCPEFEER